MAGGRREDPKSKIRSADGPYLAVLPALSVMCLLMNDFLSLRDNFFCAAAGE